MACSRVEASESAEYLVTDRGTGQVLRFAASDGTLLGALVGADPVTNGGLSMPSALAVGFDGDLFVTSVNLSTGDGQVLRYDMHTGTFRGVFASGIQGPAGLLYHEPSNTLLVSELGPGLGDSNRIVRFTADGIRMPDIVSLPVSGRTGMTVGSNGRLYVSSFAEEPFFAGSVQEYRYHAQANEFMFLGAFAAAEKLVGANGIVFDRQGEMYVASLFGQNVVRFDVEGNTVVGSRVFAPAAYPSGLLVTADDRLLVTSLGNNNPNDPIYPFLFPGSVFRYNLADGSQVDPGPFLAASGDFQPTAILLRPLQGDFNADGLLTAVDIDALSAAVRGGDTARRYDVNVDGLVNGDDRVYWVEQLKQTYFGDADLDGVFDSNDFIAVFAAGQYEDVLLGNSTWATGDWNGDTEFSSGDMVFAFQSGGYELGPRTAAAAVPEPGSLGLLLIAGIGLLRARLGRRAVRARGD